MKPLHANLMFSIVTASIPLVGDYATTSSGNVPGTGFSILLYEPFDYAYAIAVFIGFVCTNYLVYKNSANHLKSIIFTSIGSFIIWFPVVLLSLIQFHIFLGGKL